MSVITIPKKVTRGGDLVLMPRKDYERMVHALQRKSVAHLDHDLIQALKEIRQGKGVGPFSSVAELKKSLEK